MYNDVAPKCVGMHISYLLWTHEHFRTRAVLAVLLRSHASDIGEHPRRVSKETNAIGTADEEVDRVSGYDGGS